MNLILFDFPEIKKSLLPFTYTRPVGNIRIGIFTIDQKWKKYAGAAPSFLTETYLSEKFPSHITGENLLVNGAVCPDEKLWSEISKLERWSLLTYNGTPVALKTGKFSGYIELPELLNSCKKEIEYKAELTMIRFYWDIFKNNGKQIQADFNLIKKDKTSQRLDDEHTRAYNIKNIFIEPGAKIRASVLNAENGPIYLGKNSEVQEGSVIRGPFALCEGSTVNMGAKIRGDVTIGPHSKVGGEISNSIIFGYSNKGHDGFLGNSVVGEWCNLGADTNTSNLKNNYSNIKVWHYPSNDFIDTGMMFCGLAMGDHSKCGINTMFNTGTVAGVSANIFGGNFPPKFISSFSWGGNESSERFDFKKAMEVAEKVMQRRDVKLSEADTKILKWVFDNGK